MPDEVVSDFFENAGFSTLRDNPATREGYVHSLGHGLGLELHEKPGISSLNPDKSRFLPGMVFTLEPGLYFPDQSIGVRIEDVFVLKDDDTLGILSDIPRTLEVIPEN